MTSSTCWQIKGILAFDENWPINLTVHRIFTSFGSISFFCTTSIFPGFQFSFLGLEVFAFDSISLSEHAFSHYDLILLHFAA